MLRYLVEREQSGEADKLKGFSIAIDVFGKDSGFDLPPMQWCVCRRAG
ncbi:hypothetical protein [Mesorhizobium amorphae]|nr:hypothetical protein [Mesorhizobium amorphae]